MEEQINILDYGYSEESIKIELKGNTLIGLIQVLDAVINENTHVSYLNQYPLNSKVNTTDFQGNKVIDTVSVDWEKYPNANSFFSQIPVESTTVLGVQALDLKSVLQRIHMKNIEDGVAKKYEQISEI